MTKNYWCPPLQTFHILLANWSEKEAIKDKRTHCSAAEKSLLDQQNLCSVLITCFIGKINGLLS